MFNSYYRVCDKHFEDRYFTDGKKKRLRPDAVPTLNLATVQSLDTLERSLLAHCTSTFETQPFDPMSFGLSHARTLLADAIAQTQMPVVSVTTQTDTVPHSVSSTQTERKLSKRARMEKKYKAEILKLKRRCNDLQQKLNIEMKKNSIKREMLTDLLQER